MARGKRKDYASKTEAAALLKRLARTVAELERIMGYPKPTKMNLQHADAAAARAALPKARRLAFLSTVLGNFLESQTSGPHADVILSHTALGGLVSGKFRLVVDPSDNAEAADAVAAEALDWKPGTRRLAMTSIPRTQTDAEKNKSLRLALDADRNRFSSTTTIYSQILDQAVATLQKHGMPDTEIAAHLVAAGYTRSEAGPKAVAARAHRLRDRGVELPISPRARLRRDRRVKHTSTRSR